MSNWYGSRKKNKSELMSGVENVKTSKLYGSNTVKCLLNNGTEIVKYHDTIVFSEDSKGVITLNSGGFRTRTTKERINNELPSDCNIYADKGIWYLCVDCKPYVFCDGIQIKGFEVIGEKKDEEKRIKGLRKQIAKYCKSIREMKELPIPGLGDCLLCMRTKDGQVLGDVGNNKSHLYSHLDEQYIHGSLLVNALKAKGYENLSYVWNIRDLVSNAVRIYFCKQLGLSY